MDDPIIWDYYKKLQSRGPVLFSQSRHGIGGRTFRCYKFRSMVINDDFDKVFADNNDKRLTISLEKFYVFQHLMKCLNLSMFF